MDALSNVRTTTKPADRSYVGHIVIRATPWGVDGFRCSLELPIPGGSDALVILADVPPGSLRKIADASSLYQQQVSGWGFADPGRIELPYGIVLSDSTLGNTAWVGDLLGDLGGLLGGGGGGSGPAAGGGGLGGLLGGLLGGGGGSGAGGGLGSLAGLLGGGSGGSNPLAALGTLGGLVGGLGSAAGGSGGNPITGLLGGLLGGGGGSGGAGGVLQSLLGTTGGGGGGAGLPAGGTDANRSRLLSFLQITATTPPAEAIARLQTGSTNQNWRAEDRADALALANALIAGGTAAGAGTTPAATGIGQLLAQQLAGQAPAGTGPQQVASVLAGASALGTAAQTAASPAGMQMFQAMQPAVLGLARDALRGLDATAAGLTGNRQALDIVRQARERAEGNLANAFSITDSVSQMMNGGDPAASAWNLVSAITRSLATR